MPASGLVVVNTLSTCSLALCELKATHEKLQAVLEFSGRILQCGSCVRRLSYFAKAMSASTAFSLCKPIFHPVWCQTLIIIAQITPKAVHL